jgi:hypothetical protein
MNIFHEVYYKADLWRLRFVQWTKKIWRKFRATENDDVEIAL